MYNSRKVRQVKRNRRILKIVIIFILLIILLTIILPNVLLKYGNKNTLSIVKKYNLSSILSKKYSEEYIDDEEIKGNDKYNLVDLIEYMLVANAEDITISPEISSDYVIDQTTFDVNVSLKNKDDTYSILYRLNEKEIEEEISEKDKVITFDLQKEGKNDCYIAIKQNGEVKKEWSKSIYRIKSYEKQYLDELEKKGISTHFAFGMEKEEAIKLIETLGTNYIRDDIMVSKYDQNKKEYINPTFEQYIKEINDKGINIIGILNHHKSGETLGDDHIISNEQELELFNEFSKNINIKFPYVKFFEVINEPNDVYNTKEKINWYTKNLNNILNEFQRNKIFIGCTMTPENPNETRIASEEFYSEVLNNVDLKKVDNYSFHIYDISKKGVLNEREKEVIKKHKSMFNANGGFIKSNITEFRRNNM